MRPREPAFQSEANESLASPDPGWLAGIPADEMLSPLAIDWRRPQPSTTHDDRIALPQALGASSQNIFVRAWLPITLGEIALLGITATLPKDWTGWSPDFVRDGMGNLKEAWTSPPVMDTDNCLHNYLGHPYGGSFYYNSVRCRGATFGQSMAFSAVLSTQWEYVFEAVAERPSIQDLIITPVAGAALGELVHRMTNSMVRGGTSFPEKVVITVLNPAHVLAHGYK